MLRSDEGVLGPASAVAMLDTIDEIRATLSGLQGENDQCEFYEEILAVLPQFVAVGPQSAGKSSVIRRVSGVALPEASTLCTRVATMVQMRSAKEPIIAVILQGPGAETLMEEVFDEAEAEGTKVKDAVKRAQDTALARSPGKQFVDNYTVLVKVRGPKKPNVTLVDLPGFHTADDDDTKTVNAMVKRYVEMPGTLALHVVKGDQDYGSLLGNDFLRGIQGMPRVTVLTHCDKLDKTSKDDAQRLRTTLNTTTEISSLTVAVLGCGRKDAEEVEMLRHLIDMDARVEVGASVLGVHLEERIHLQLETQYPKAIAKLQASLTETTARLDEVREQSPSEVFYQMTLQVQQTFELEKPKLMNELRKVLADMTMQIKNYMVNAHATHAKTLSPIDDFDDPLECGKIVFVMLTPQSIHASRVMVTGIKGNEVFWQEAFPDAGKTPETGTSKKSELYSGEIHDVKSMIEDIKLLAADRGMRNFVHIDRQPIIAKYAQAFAKHYTTVNRNTARLIQKNVNTLFDTVFSKDVPEIAKSAAIRFRMRLAEHLKNAEMDCEEAIEAMEAHNTLPDLIFSPNEHYLNDLIQRMVAQDKEIATDDGGMRHIYHNVRAYIKVQRKQISETAAKELIRTLVLKSEDHFRALLKAGLPEYAQFIKEPKQVARERETLKKRQQVLQEALDVAQRKPRD